MKKILKDKAKLRKLVLFGLGGLYLAGAVINSINNGINNTFHQSELPLLELNPIKNIIAVFTPTGIGVIGFFVIMYCLFTKKGWVKIKV